MHVVDISNRMRMGTAGWIHDGIQWRRMYGLWVRDFTAGTWEVSADYLAPVSCQIAPLDHLSARVTWSVLGAESVEVYVNGVKRYQQNYNVVPGSAVPSSGSYNVTELVPGSKPSAYVKARYGNTWVTQVTPTSTQLPGLPTPATVSVGSITTSSMVISWSAVNGATSYEVYDSKTHTMLRSTTALSWSRTGLTGNTTYSMYVKARYSASVVSVASAIKSGTTAATFVAGSWIFEAKKCNTWQATKQEWRGTSDGQVWHGNGQKWAGTSRGTQTAYFMQYEASNGQTVPQFFAGKQTRVTKVEVWVRRVDTAHGIWSDQECRFYKHNDSSFEANGPDNVGSSHNNGKLGRGEGKWITLPVSWGEALIAGTIQGFAWGGTGAYSDGARYMIGPSLSANHNMMQVRITTS